MISYYNNNFDLSEVVSQVRQGVDIVSSIHSPEEIKWREVLLLDFVWISGKEIPVVYRPKTGQFFSAKDIPDGKFYLRLDRDNIYGASLYAFPVWDEQSKKLNCFCFDINLVTYRFEPVGSFTYDQDGFHSSIFNFITETGRYTGDKTRYICFQGCKFESVNVLGEKEETDCLDKMVYDYYHFPGGSTMMRLRPGGYDFVRADLAERPSLNERLTFTDDDNRYRSCYEIDTNDSIDPSVVKLDEAIEAEVAEKLKQQKDNFGVSFCLAMAKAGEGKAKRDLAVIYVGLKSPWGFESAPFVIVKVSNNATWKDGYVRYHDGWYRLKGYSLRQIHRQTANSLVVVGTLKDETRIKNKDLARAVAGSNNGQITVSDLVKAGKVRYGATFCEQLLKLSNKPEEIKAYKMLADSIIKEAQPKHEAWQFTHSLSELIPGMDETKTSIYEIMGLKKAWAKFVLQETIKDASQKDISWRDLAECYKAAKFAIEDCKQSDISPSKTAESIVDDYLDFASDGLLTDDFILAYPNKSNWIEVIRQCRRMKKKILTAGGHVYYGEIVGHYFRLKAHGIDPKANNIFLEFGLPETGEGDVLDMLRRREEQAARCVEIHDAEINKEEHEKIENAFKETKKQYKGLASKKGETFGPGKLLALAPSQIFGLDDPLSIQHEGAAMHHCVFRCYATNIAKGEYKIIYLRKKKDEAYITVGIKRDGTIEQARRESDKPISSEDTLALKAWAKSREGQVRLAKYVSGCPNV